jgi:hypothetical protein
MELTIITGYRCVQNVNANAVLGPAEDLYERPTVQGFSGSKETVCYRSYSCIYQYQVSKQPWEITSKQATMRLFLTLLLTQSLSRNARVLPRSCESVIRWTLLTRQTCCWEGNEYKQVFIKVEHWNIVMVLYWITEVHMLIWIQWFFLEVWQWFFGGMTDDPVSASSRGFTSKNEKSLKVSQWTKKYFKYHKICE